MRWAFWSLLAALACAGAAQSQAPAAAPVPPLIALDDHLPDIDPDGMAHAWIDDSGKAGIAQALAARAAFKPQPARSVHRLGSGAALWLHWRMARPAAARQDWFIEFPLPLLDLATLYQQDADGRWQSQSAGDTLAVASWPEPGRYPFFKLDLPPGQARDVYVRIRHSTALSLPMRLASQASHDNAQQLQYLGLGIVFGALLLLVGACAMLAWLYQDRDYGWYCAYAALSSLAIAAYTGVAAHVLWNGSAIWSDSSQGVLAILAGASSLLLVRRVCGMSARNLGLDRSMRWLAGVGFVLAPVYIALGRETGSQALGLYLTAVVAFNLLGGASAWRRGDRVGVWLVAGFAPMGLAVMVALARVFGWVATSSMTQYSVVGAMALEVPLLLAALNVRSRERHRAQVREEALSTQDALTGLLAPHLFQDRLRQVIARFRRSKGGAAVVFVELVNYGRIKEHYGIAVAEQSLLRSVIKLRRVLRDVDTTSRIGEARFGLIMEGVTQRSAVTDRAARLVAAGLMPTEGLQPDVTLQFHTAAVLLHERDMEATEMSEALVELLGSMSPRTRRPIRFLEPEHTRPMSLEAMDSLQEE